MTLNRHEALKALAYLLSRLPARGEFVSWPGLYPDLASGLIRFCLFPVPFSVWTKLLDWSVPVSPFVLACEIGVKRLQHDGVSCCSRLDLHTDYRRGALPSEKKQVRTC